MVPSPPTSIATMEAGSTIFAVNSPLKAALALIAACSLSISALRSVLTLVTAAASVALPAVIFRTVTLVPSLMPAMAATSASVVPIVAIIASEAVGVKVACNDPAAGRGAGAAGALAAGAPAAGAPAAGAPPAGAAAAGAPVSTVICAANAGMAIATTTAAAKLSVRFI